MRPSYASLCSVSIFFFGKRDKHSCSASAIINLSMVSIVDSLLSTLHASANRILRFEANAYFIGSGFTSSLFFLLGLPPSFLVFRGFAAQRSRARALPLLNLKKKRDCSQSIKIMEQSTWLFQKSPISERFFKSVLNNVNLTTGVKCHCNFYTYV